MQPLENRLWHWQEIAGPDGVVYLRRFVIARLPGNRRIYLHHFVGDDWSRDPHDHPKAFWSIGLWGGYVEEVFERRPVRIGRLPLRLVLAHTLRWRAPWIRRFPAEHIHRIRLADGRHAWTLVITGPETRPWGFWRDSRWVHYLTYLRDVDRERAAP